MNYRDDYRATESTLIDDVPVREREMSTIEIVSNIKQELNEVISCLSNIKMHIDGECVNERKTDEPKCLNDDIKAIERMATDCIGLSHTIYDKLFHG